MSLSRAEVERFVEAGFVRIEAAFRVVWLKKDGGPVTPEDDTPGHLDRGLALKQQALEPSFR